MAKPKPEVALEHAKSLIDSSEKRDIMFDALEKLYDQTGVAANAEDTAVLVQMPYATNTIDLVADLAAPLKVAIEIPAASEAQNAKKDAENLESWVQALLSLNERQHGNLVRDCAWYGAMRAAVVIRTLYIESVAATLPVWFSARDPRYVYAEWGPGGVQTVVESWTRKASEIRRNYPTVALAKYDDDEDVRWIEYWTDTYRIYFADDEPVKVKRLGAVVPHGYGCLPYAFGMGRVTPRARPEQKYRPLLAGAASLLYNIDIWTSIALTAAHDTVTNAWLVKSDSYGAHNQKNLDLSADAINYLGKDDQVAPLQRAPLPADFFQVGTQLLNVFQQATFPFAVYGQMANNIAGYAISLLQQSGRRPLLPIWDAIERAYEQAIRNALTICREKVAPLLGGNSVPLMVTEFSEKRRIKRKLNLDTRMYGPDVDVFVTLSDPLPSDEAANLRMAMEAMTSGLLSQETALQKFNIVPDPTHEIDRIMAEMAFKQIAPVEGVKLAVERGLAPRTITLPAGWQMVNGKLLPTAFLPPEAPPQAQSQMSPGGSPPAMPGLDQANLQRIASQPQMPELAQMAGEPPLLMEPQLP